VNERKKESKRKRGRKEREHEDKNERNKESMIQRNKEIQNETKVKKFRLFCKASSRKQ
jgi:hypothetical protein